MKRWLALVGVGRIVLGKLASVVAVSGPSIRVPLVRTGRELSPGGLRKRGEARLAEIPVERQGLPDVQVLINTNVVQSVKDQRLSLQSWNKAHAVSSPSPKD